MPIAPSSLRFPSAYLQILVNMAAAYEMPVEPLLSRYGIHMPEGWRNDIEMLMDGDQFAALLRGLSDFIERGDEKVQAKILKEFPLTIHGYVGLAAMTAANLQQALDIGVRYFHHVMPAFDTNYAIEGDTCVFSATPISDFGEYNSLLAETALCAVNSALSFSDLGYDGLTVTFQHDQLVMTDFTALYPGISVKMGCAQNTLVFPAVGLKTSLNTSNPATFSMIEAELARREKLLAYKQTLVYKVFTMIREFMSAGGTVDAQIIAKQLNVSLRTFNRRLQDEGTTFKAIHDQSRLDLALQLLTQTNRSMVSISSELGFVNESSFSRYIKDKMNISPSQYRNRSRG